jgi:hypothetical protein
MRPARRPGRRLAAALLALLGIGGCARHPDLAHWRDAGRRPRPPVRIEPVAEHSLPFCPGELRAAPEFGIEVRDGARALVVDVRDGCSRPADPTPDAAEDDAADAARRAAAAVAAAHPDIGVVLPIGTWDGRVYLLAAASGVLHAARLERPKIAWSVRVGAAIATPPQIYRGRLILQSLDNYVYCLRADNGHEMWRTRLSHRLMQPAAFWEDVALVVPEAASMLHVLDLVDGSEAGSWTLPDPDGHFVAGPAVLPGGTAAAVRAAWGSLDCTLVVLRLENG